MDSTKVASRLQALDLEDSSSHPLLQAAHSRFHHPNNNANVSRLNNQQSFVHSCDTLPLSPAATSSGRWSEFGGGDADDYTSMTAKKFAALGLDGPVLSSSQQQLSSAVATMSSYQQSYQQMSLTNSNNGGNRGMFSVPSVSTSSSVKRDTTDVAALSDIAWTHSNDRIERGQHHSQPRPIYLHSPRRNSADFSSTPTNAATSASSIYSNGTMYGTSNQGIKILDLVLASTPSGGANGYLTDHDSLHEAAALAAADSASIGNINSSSADGETTEAAAKQANGNCNRQQQFRLSGAGSSSTSTQADETDAQRRGNLEGDGHLVFDPTGSEFDDTAVFVNNDDADATSAKQATSSNADKNKHLSGSGPRRMSGSYGRRQRHYSRGSNVGLLPGDDYGRNRSGYSATGVAVNRYYPVNSAAVTGFLLPSTPTRHGGGGVSMIPGAKNFPYNNNNPAALAISPPNSSYFSQYNQHQQALMYGVTPPQNMPVFFPATYQRSVSVSNDAANAVAVQLGSTPTSINSFFPQFNGYNVPMPTTLMNGSAAANAVAAAAAAEQQTQQQLSAALYNTNNAAFGTNNTAPMLMVHNPSSQPAARAIPTSAASMYLPAAASAAAAAVAQANLTSLINNGTVAYDAVTNTTFVVGSPQTHNLFPPMQQQQQQQHHQQSTLQPPPAFTFAQPAAANLAVAPASYLMYDPSAQYNAPAGTTGVASQPQFVMAVDENGGNAYAGGSMSTQQQQQNLASNNSHNIMMTNGFGAPGGVVNGYPQFLHAVHQQQYGMIQPASQMAVPNSRKQVAGATTNTMVMPPITTQRTPPHPLPQQAAAMQQQQQQHQAAATAATAGSGGSAQKPRSRLLEDFRNNQLPDMRLSAVRGHVNEFARDQHGSRFIQQHLDDAAVEDLTMVFDEIDLALYDLSTDVFANYVVQKYFECCTRDQRIMLGRRITDDIWRMSIHMYGCRVAQKALEVLDSPMKEQLALAFAPHVIELIRDQNGNHVVQKALETVASQNMQFIVDSCRNQLTDLSVHMYGCRVVQRMMENLNNEQLRVILDELVDHTESLVRNEFGNYVIQHILEHGQPETKNRVIAHLKGHLYEYCQDKYASNVMEKCISNATRAQRQTLLEEIIQGDRASGGTALLALLRDQFGNYVVQKMIDLAEPQQRKQLLHQIKPHILVLRKFHYGKHIIAKLEKFLGTQQVAAATASAQQLAGNSSNMNSPPNGVQGNAAVAAGFIPPPPQMPPNGALQHAGKANNNKPMPLQLTNNNNSAVAIENTAAGQFTNSAGRRQLPPQQQQQQMFSSGGGNLSSNRQQATPGSSSNNNAPQGAVTTSLYSGAKLQSRHAVLNMSQPGPNVLGSINHQPLQQQQHHHRRHQKENVGVTLSSPDVSSAALPAYSQYGIKPQLSNGKMFVANNNNNNTAAYQQSRH